MQKRLKYRISERIDQINKGLRGSYAQKAQTRKEILASLNERGFTTARETLSEWENIGYGDTRAISSDVLHIISKELKCTMEDLMPPLPPRKTQEN